MKSSSGIITPLGNSLPRGAWLVVMFLFIVGALSNHFRPVIGQCPEDHGNVTTS